MHDLPFIATLGHFFFPKFPLTSLIGINRDFANCFALRTKQYMLSLFSSRP